MTAILAVKARSIIGGHRAGTSLDRVLRAALVALVIWGLWIACRPRPRFVVQIRGGVPRLTRGQITRAFVQEIGEACRRHAVLHGEVRGVVDGRRIGLTFSGDLPEPCRQQLRNIWNVSGWSSIRR